MSASIVESTESIEHLDAGLEVVCDAKCEHKAVAFTSCPCCFGNSAMLCGQHVAQLCLNLERILRARDARCAACGHPAKSVRDAVTVTPL